MNVLIIDESPLISGRLKNILTETGIPMVVYQSVEHVKIISLFADIQPVLVLLDMGLQDSLSTTLLQQMKATGITTSIIALVNCEAKSIQLKTNNPGIDAIIDKYHEFESIPGIVERLIKEHQYKTDYEKPNQYTKFA